MDLAPETMLTTAVTNMPMLLMSIAKKVQAGDFVGGSDLPGFAAGALAIGPLNDAIPEDGQAKIQETIDAIISGDLEVPVISEQTD